MSRKPTWAGRLPGGLAPEAWSFLHSLPHDRHLWADDVAGTKAHVAGLRAAEVLSAAEAKRLTRELDRIAGTPEVIEDDDEDVHSAIERVLTERLGDLGAKVHAGRSRNDQVATAVRLWTRRGVLEVWTAVIDVLDVLASRAPNHATTICPGYTHLQRAQPVTVGHWMCAHAFALVRDAARLSSAYAAADVSPLGAGALAGNTLGLDPRVPAAGLGFSRVFDNTLDAVSDRDFLCDASYAAAMTITHISRLAEELVIWSSSEFGFVRLPDAYATGSSMMPQKRNPDVAELARGQVGPVVGSLVALLSTLKALPLAYDRDLQADKQALGASLATTASALRAIAGLLSHVEFDEERLRAAADDEALLATDLAEALVARGVPFREAHGRIAGLVRAAEAAGTLHAAVRAEPAAVAPLTTDEAVRLLEPGASLRRRSTPGGPKPASVRRQARRLSRVVGRDRAAIEQLRATLPA